MAQPLPIAKVPGGSELSLLPALSNRHGLITGATGTGKTVTLQVMAEQFSRIGVPTFMADVKGDLAGIAAAGVAVAEADRAAQDASARTRRRSRASPVVFWDVFGKSGHPVRATISDMGPLLLGRLLDLNETQRGVLTLVFKIADDNGLLLLDSKDLRAMLQFVGDNAKQFTTDYGNISAASIGAIQRGLMAIETQGGDKFFGEPMLDIDDLLQTAERTRRRQHPGGRSADERAEALRDVSAVDAVGAVRASAGSGRSGQAEDGVLLRRGAPALHRRAEPALVQKIEQVVRLIRSKGVGVYFVTQNPLDVPETVLGQLGNRVQHALRAFTPRDQKAVNTAASTLRANPKLKTEQVITELGVGEALVSFLDEKGTPTVVERALILPPASRIGAITEAERAAVINASLVKGHYEQTVDRESAYEKLRARTTDRQGTGKAAPPAPLPASGRARRRRQTRT